MTCLRRGVVTDDRKLAASPTGWSLGGGAGVEGIAIPRSRVSNFSADYVRPLENMPGGGEAGMYQIFL